MSLKSPQKEGSVSLTGSSGVDGDDDLRTLITPLSPKFPAWDIHQEHATLISNENKGPKLNTLLDSRCMLTSKSASMPFAISSVIRYDSDAGMSTLTNSLNALPRLTNLLDAASKYETFGPLLTLEWWNHPQPNFKAEVTSYDPLYLDDPDLRSGKDRTVLTLAGTMTSILPYVRPETLETELNLQFKQSHDWLHGTRMSLTKIRNLKRHVIDAIREGDMEVSCVNAFVMSLFSWQLQPVPLCCLRNSC